MALANSAIAAMAITASTIIVFFFMIGGRGGLFEFAEEGREAYAVVYEGVQVGDVYACLLHGVAFAECHGVVLEGLVVYGDAEWSAYCVLAAVAFADCVFLFIVCGEVEFEVVDNLAGLFGESVFTHEGQHGALDGG